MRPIRDATRATTRGVEIQQQASGGARLRWRGCVLLAGALTVLMFYDIAILRWYYGLSLPNWLWGVEHYVSRYSHLAAIGLGLVVLGWGGRKWFWHGVGVLAVSSFVVMLLKFGIGRVRPGNAGDPFLFFGINGVHDSYPSGHAVAIWAMVFVLLRYDRRIGIGWVIAGLVVAWARMHAQAHYVSDLVAGGLVAIACERVWWWRFHSVGGASAGAVDEGTTLKSRGWLVWIGQVLPWILVVLLPVGAMLPARSTVIAKRSAAEYDELIYGVYQRLMNREVDSGALALWRVELPKRRVVSDILFQFAVSREFSDSIQTGAATIEGRVGAIYERLLDRSPSEIELSGGMALLGSLDNREQHRYGTRLLSIRLILSSEYLERYGAFYLPGEVVQP